MTFTCASRLKNVIVYISASVMGGVDTRKRERVHEDIKGIVSIIRDY